MDGGGVDAVSKFVETRARCLAAQERAHEVLSQAVASLKIAEERLQRAQAVRLAAREAAQRHASGSELFAFDGHRENADLASYDAVPGLTTAAADATALQ